jgi:hypothetical protein
VSGARDEVLQPLEALLELTLERVRMVAVAGGLGVRSIAEMVVEVCGGVQMMNGLGVVGVVRMKGTTLVGVAGVGMEEGMVGMEAGAGKGARMLGEVGAGMGVAGVAGAGTGVEVVAGECGVGDVAVAGAGAGAAVGEGVAVAVAGVGVGVMVRESVLVVRSH